MIYYLLLVFNMEEHNKYALFSLFIMASLLTFINVYNNSHIINFNKPIFLGISNCINATIYTSKNVKVMLLMDNKLINTYDTKQIINIYYKREDNLQGKYSLKLSYDKKLLYPINNYQNSYIHIDNHFCNGTRYSILYNDIYPCFDMYIC